MGLFDGCSLNLQHFIVVALCHSFNKKASGDTIRNMLFCLFQIKKVLLSVFQYNCYLSSVVESCASVSFCYIELLPSQETATFILIQLCVL